MDYGRQCSKILAAEPPHPLVRLYIGMAEEFYRTLAPQLRARAQGEHEAELAATFERAVDDFIATLATWRDFGWKSSVAAPELDAFEARLRANPHIFAETTAVLQMLREEAAATKRAANPRTWKAVDVDASSIKDLIPDDVWGIDLQWLKDVLNEILDILG